MRWGSDSYIAWAGADEIPAMPICTAAQRGIQSGNVGILAYAHKIFPICKEVLCKISP